MFGKKRLATLIRENASSTSEKILHSIIESLKAFRRSVKQEDHVTLAVVKIVNKQDKPRLVAKRSEKDSPLFSQTRFMLWLFQEMRTFAHYLFLKLLI